MRPRPMLRGLVLAGPPAVPLAAADHGAALGARVDIRALHDRMLVGGAMPPELLDARTDAWIAAAKAGHAPAH